MPNIWAMLTLCVKNNLKGVIQMVNWGKIWEKFMGLSFSGKLVAICLIVLAVCVIWQALRFAFQITISILAILVVIFVAGWAIGRFKKH